MGCCLYNIKKNTELPIVLDIEKNKPLYNDFSSIKDRYYFKPIPENQCC